jgi:hypothetical protein
MPFQHALGGGRKSSFSHQLVLFLHMVIKHSYLNIETTSITMAGVVFPNSWGWNVNFKSRKKIKRIFPLEKIDVYCFEWFLFCN